MKRLPKRIVNIAMKYKVIVSYDFKNCGKNRAACAGNEIFIGDFRNKELELIAFFHELGHIKSSKYLKTKFYMTTISCEGMAWEVGLKLAKENGIEWEYNSKPLKWARKQLKTYNKAENFK